MARQRKGRDKYGRFRCGKWYLEVNGAEIEFDRLGFPMVTEAYIEGLNYRGDWFRTRMVIDDVQRNDS